jgi:uncharacterized protein YkwD
LPPIQRLRRWTVLSSFVLLALSPQSRDTAYAPAIAELEKVAHDLAKSGRSSDLDETLQILAELGMDVKAREKLASTCRQDASKVKKPAAATAGAVASVQKAAKDVSARLPSTPDSERANLARLILRLDDRVAEAHAALGEELVDGEWLDAAAKARHARTLVIDMAVAKARQLDLKLDIAPSHHPELAGVRSGTPSMAKYGSVEFHGVWPEEKLRRVALATLRCAALIQFLSTDRLEVPTFAPRSLVLFNDRQEFQAAVRRGGQAGRVDPQIAAMIDKLDAAYFGQDEFATFQPYEGYCASVLLGDLMSHVQWKSGSESADFLDLEPWIVSGLINWSTLSLLGERLPVYVIGETKESRSASGRTAALSAEEKLVRERMLRLSEAGISGGRAWLEYLARRGEDPPLSGSFRDQMGRIQGDDLLKTTFVVERFIQEGPLVPLLLRLRKTPSVEAATHAFEIARKRSLADFEHDWRNSFLPALPGLAQRLGGGAAEARIPEADQQALELLNTMRARAGSKNGPIDVDAATSKDCLKHAHYLARHPEQRDKWPDAHEEYLDRSEFDPRGAWAGAHSVVASGVKSPRDAVQGWMATFYHRLPLLDPNLVRIGIGIEDGCAVLDCGSFLKPTGSSSIAPRSIDSKDPTIWGTAWPPPKGVDVPTHFAAEVPEPVPGVSSATLGYPVTLQVCDAEFETYDVALVLHLGTAKGPAVDCYCSTPTEPTNPKVPPRLAWCLMPRSALQPGATYTVTGTMRVSTDPQTYEIEWSFRCGK